MRPTIRRSRPHRFLLAALLLPALAGWNPRPARATPYVPPEVLRREALRAPETSPGPTRPAPNEVLEERVYPLDYMQVLEWLTGMQVADPGVNFGGMREGEQDWTVIQTDNTQEALRDWARYGALSGDTSRYRPYIDAAWTYILSHPAYLEEGGGNPNYYRVHNCGWGLVAVMEYTKTYGDSSYVPYGDSCASYIDTWRLSWSGVGVELNPLSAGFGAGALSLYAEWRDRPDWDLAAREIAGDVRAWIEDDPDRLNSNETWAMCGGTAMWGVVTALFRDRPDSAAAWIPQYSSFMDTYAGPPTGPRLWNNSMTVWYGHAWHAIHRVLGDDESYQNALWVVDHLLAQDEPDDDGGIPATENLYENDQSWTSAYLVWYGLEPLFADDPDRRDAALLAAAPDTSWPIAAGDSVTFRLTVANNGFGPLPGVQLLAQAGAFSASATVDLPFAGSAEVALAPAWVPAATGAAPVLFTVQADGDTSAGNDSLAATYTVLPRVFVEGHVRRGADGAGIPAAVRAFNLDADPAVPFAETRTEGDEGAYSLPVVPGLYRVMVLPEAIGFTPRSLDSLAVGDTGLGGVDFTLFPAPVLYVSEDPTGVIDPYFLGVLDTLGVDAFPWRLPEEGWDDAVLDAPRTVIWATGNGGDEITLPGRAAEIETFLDGGGSVLLTGQHLMDVLDGQPLLDRFAAQAGRLALMQRILAGTGESFVDADEFLVLLGADGAGNQSEPDEVIPAEGGVAVLEYASFDAPAAVAHADSATGARTLLCGFGVEAIGQPTAAVLSRAEFLDRALRWLEGETGAPDVPVAAALPGELRLEAWPNPFNPRVTVRVSLPRAAEVRLSLYDILGRRVARWPERRLAPGAYGFTWGGHASSGVYLLVLETPGARRAVRLVRLK